jgi:tRNA pseudouridine55 synthase
MSSVLRRGGALLIDKPEGPTSFGVVATLRGAMGRALGLKRRELPAIGHGGTLDPFATGLLVVLIGQGTKLAQYFLDSEKRYTGTIRFGARTESGDFTNPIVERTTTLPRSLEELRASAGTFVGAEYLQLPPMFSAKKQDGRALYELARKGIEVERAPKSCRISRFEISAYDGVCARFEVSCSAGTYIRVLAEDVAQRLGSLAALESLRREGSGSLSIERAISPALALEQVVSWSQSPAWVPLEELVAGMPRIDVSPSQALRLERGQQEILREIRISDGAPVTALYCEDILRALVRTKNGQPALERVFTM